MPFAQPLRSGVRTLQRERERVSSTLASVVTVNLSSGIIKPLDNLPLGDLGFVTETTFDAHNAILRLLGDSADGTQLLSLDVRTSLWGKTVAVDLSSCEGGTACLSELRWDGANQRIIAVAVGYLSNGTVHNAIVTIDPVTGAVRPLLLFSKYFALYEFSSAFSVTAQVFYAWLGRGPRALLVSFDLATGRNQTLQDVEEHLLSAPCICIPGHGIVAVSPEMRLVQISTTQPLARPRNLSTSIGGIPSNNGLAWSNTSGQPVVYAPLVNFEKNLLASFELATGSLGQITLNATVDYPYIDEYH